MNKTVKGLALFLVLTAVPLTAAAEEITATVKGMVCSFCAQGIKKTFGKNEHVEKVEVDLDNKLVKLKVKEGHVLTDEVITKAIADAGYDVLKIERESGA
jgi:copper chaperone CopZ